MNSSRANQQLTDILLKRSKHSDPEVRMQVALDVRTPSTIINSMLINPSESPSIIEAILNRKEYQPSNPNIPASNMTELARTNNTEIDAALLNNPNITPDALLILAQKFAKSPPPRELLTLLWINDNTPASARIAIEKIYMITGKEPVRPQETTASRIINCNDAESSRSLSYTNHAKRAANYHRES